MWNGVIERRRRDEEQGAHVAHLLLGADQALDVRCDLAQHLAVDRGPVCASYNASQEPGSSMFRNTSSRSLSVRRGREMVERGVDPHSSLHEAALLQRHQAPGQVTERVHLQQRVVLEVVADGSEAPRIERPGIQRGDVVHGASSRRRRSIR
jgi:hypothetical protein